MTTSVANAGVDWDRQRTTKEERESHSFWYSMLRPHSRRRHARLFRWVIALLILLDVAAFVLESDARLRQRGRALFPVLQGLSSCVFLLEYALRLWTVPQSSRYRGVSRSRARLQWVRTWESAVDVISFLPWFIERGAAAFLRVCGSGYRLSLPNLSVLRVLRLFRLLKAQPVVSAFDVVARVLFYNSEILCVSVLICAVLVLMLSTVLFYLRPEEGDTEDDFSSIPATMYLSVMMLTGQGQPSGKLPWYTKLIVILTAISAVAQFAIPASMLTWGFEAEAARRMKKQFQRRQKIAERKRLAVEQGLAPQASQVTSSSSEGTTTEWEEYERIIVEPTEEGLPAAGVGGGGGGGAGGGGGSAAEAPGAVGGGSASASGVEVSAQALLRAAGQLESLQSEVLRLKEKNRVLEAELARMRGPSPGVGGGAF